MYNNSSSARSRNKGGPKRGGPNKRHRPGTRSYGGGNRGRGGGGGRRRGQNIDPARFVKAAKPVEHVEYEPTHSFDDFEIESLIKRNLAFKKFVKPSQIQDQAIPVALEGKDVIGIANTGTGKTAAFMIPLLNKMIRNRGEKTLILAPTRELAQQIQMEGREIAKGSKIYDVLLIGGSSMGRQLGDLRRGADIFVGTPGRIKDHLERGTLKLDKVTTIVLDEVDRMLDMGFINDIRTILGAVTNEHQSMFFSATMTNSIERLISDFTHSPVKIMARTAETSDNVEQSVVKYAGPQDKLEKLKDVLSHDDSEKILVFTETKRSADKLSGQLNDMDFVAEAMHGNKSQGQRERALRKFKKGHAQILVATDVAARGIDVSGITHVVNYDIPQTYDDYTHRIGRTGRGGETGNAVTFVGR